MRVLLPPSETKRDGGDHGPVALSRLSFAVLEPTRERVVAAAVKLAANPATCMRVLKLGPKLAFEVERNSRIRTSPTMPAIDRYTGVLYDALGAPELGTSARHDVLANVIIQSAMFGPVSASYLIPAYRLSYTSKLPALRVGLVPLWTKATSHLNDLWTGFTLDARSEGYAGLTPVPEGVNAVYLRVATRDSAGRVAALNHFNKKSKGELLRSLAESGDLPAIGSADDLRDWGAANGWTFAPRDGCELVLLVDPA